MKEGERERQIHKSRFRKEKKKSPRAMTVPYLRNPNRSRRRAGLENDIKLSKSTYHREPEHYHHHHHVGRRTKGGGGGGYVYGGSSAAVRDHDGDKSVAIVFGVIGGIVVLLFCCFLCLACFVEIREKKQEQQAERRREMANNNNNQPSTDNSNGNDNSTQPSRTAALSSEEQGDSSDGVVPSNCCSNMSYNKPTRQEKMLENFKFQTVLPDDKSNSNNTNPKVLFQKKDKSDDSSTITDNESDSVIQQHLSNKDNGIEAPHHKDESFGLSSRFLLSTWRRPTENDECAICLQGYEADQTICTSSTTQCNHVFHQDCLEEWLKDHDNCPMCRVNLMYSPPS
eukprot:scaffold1772_cov80-Cylindrotheca_fusiformis.AAC.2